MSVQVNTEVEKEDEVVDPELLTIDDRHLLQQDESELKIWQFKCKDWRTFDIQKPAQAKELVWQFAQKFLKMTFFCQGTFDAGAVDAFLSGDHALLVYTKTEWKNKISNELRRMRNRLLTDELCGRILPLWRKDTEYPVKEGVVETEDSCESNARTIWFRQKAESDTYSIQGLTAPVAECVNWEKISAQRTDMAKYTLEWVLTMMSQSADIVYRLGEEPQVARQRNKLFSSIATQKSPPDIHRVPILDSFRCGKRVPMRMISLELNVVDSSDEESDIAERFKDCSYQSSNHGQPRTGSHARIMRTCHVTAETCCQTSPGLRIVSRQIQKVTKPPQRTTRGWVNHHLQSA